MRKAPEGSDKCMIFTRLFIPPKPNCNKELQSIWKEQTKCISHRTPWSSTVRENFFFGLVIMSSTVPYTWSTHTALKWRWCLSLGTFSSSTHSCGTGNSLCPYFTPQTVSLGCLYLYIGNPWIRRSIRCTFSEVENMLESGPWTQWVTDSTHGPISANSTSSPKTVKTLPCLQKTKISWRKLVNSSTRCKPNWTTTSITKSLCKTRWFNLWRKVLCTSRRSSRWFLRVTISILLTSWSTLTTPSGHSSQLTTTEGIFWSSI